MRILITGNMGYVGSVLCPWLREYDPSSQLFGLDTGLFKNNLSIHGAAPEIHLNKQIEEDIRNTSLVLPKADALIHLAAVSNDPIGHSFDVATHQINFEGTLNIAHRAKKAGYKAFILASSCSVYGFSNGESVNENSPVNPLTAYARTKYASEIELMKLSQPDFKVICLRFATACGFSPRIRLDLVLNDFVASALTNNSIEILSDGLAWRPLIAVRDMCRAFTWMVYNTSQLHPFEIFNVGSESWNYTIRELANEVKQCFPHCQIHIKGSNNTDHRSYRVNFEKFQRRAREVVPAEPIQNTIMEMKENLENYGFRDSSFRQSDYIRLNALNHLLKNNNVSEALSIQPSLLQ